MMKWAKIILSLYLLLVGFNISAQSTIIIDKWNTASRTKIDGNWVDTLKGNVLLHQQDKYFQCDTAILIGQRLVAKGNIVLQQGDSLFIYGDHLNYDGNTKKGELDGNVVLVSQGQKLFTEKLFYDANTKIASFDQKGILSDGENILSSNKGNFDTKQNLAKFFDDVRISDSADSTFKTRTDTLVFDTKTKIAQFVCPTIIRYKASQIYSEGGIYNLATKTGYFDKKPQFISEKQKGIAKKMIVFGNDKTFIMQGNAQLKEGDQIAKADSIVYQEKTEDVSFYRNAKLKGPSLNAQGDTLHYNRISKIFTSVGLAEFSDSTQIVRSEKSFYDQNTGIGLLTGEVEWIDTVNKIIVKTPSLFLNKKKNQFKTLGGKSLIILISDKDSIFISADTIIKESLYIPDSSQVLRAFPDVRIYMKDMQGVADSLGFSDKDSIIRLLGRPILWTDTGKTQLNSDTILLTMKQKKPDKIHLISQASVNSLKQDIYFDQIAGRTIIGTLSNGAISEMWVTGNAQTVFYATDEKNEFLGVNVKKCARMRLEFVLKKIVKVWFYKQPEGKFLPLKGLDPESIKLNPFTYNPEWRPINVQALMLQNYGRIKIENK